MTMLDFFIRSSRPLTIVDAVPVRWHNELNLALSAINKATPLTAGPDIQPGSEQIDD
jgi:hypothetical protein